MGGKSSKSELNRSKSFSTFGRSSQRSQFQKAKLALNQINKKLPKEEDATKLEDIKRQLERIEKDLNEMSPAIKEKNKQKYEDISKYFNETKEKFEQKVKPNRVEETVHSEEKLQTSLSQPDSPKSENDRQIVELKIVKISSCENLNIDEDDEDMEIRDVEVRKPLTVNEDLNKIEEVPTSPKIKFGVQVMPINPRISQELLKRNTLPVNEIPKQEFKKIRNISDSEEEEEKKSRKHISYPNSPNSDKRFVLETLQKREVNGGALEKIEAISKDIDVLEHKLKYFKGKKGDKDYLILHQLFVTNLIKLDGIDVQDEPVVRQERNISIKRIQELIRILECLVQQDVIDKDGSEVEERSNFNEEVEVKKQEEVTNMEGKPVTATAL